MSAVNLRGTASAALRQFLVQAGLPFAANDNISAAIAAVSHQHNCRASDLLEQLELEVARAISSVMDALVIDTDNDHNTRETARRVAKMYVREVFNGRYAPQPAVTDFPNAKKLDQLYVAGPITVRSACSHHLVPIVGRAWIGVIPGSRVIGLSKFNRLVEWICARPQIQEEAAMQVADLIEKLVKPAGLAVVIKASHMCMTWRGVRETSEAAMVTSVMRGTLMDDATARAEFLKLIEVK